MDPTIWIYVVEAIIVAAISIAITILVKNGHESKILGFWESMKTVWNTWKDIVAAKNPELAESVTKMMQTLEDAFADGGLTLAEFEAIRQSFLPIWNELVEFIKNLTGNNSIGEESFEKFVKAEEAKIEEPNVEEKKTE